MRFAITTLIPLTPATSVSALRPMAACGVRHAGIQRAPLSLSPRLNPQGLPEEDEEGEEHNPLPKKRRRLPFPSPAPFGRDIETTITFKRGPWRRPRETKPVLKEFRPEPRAERILGKRIEIPDFIRGALTIFGRRG